jgi:hypothetical protein
VIALKKKDNTYCEVVNKRIALPELEQVPIYEEISLV